MFKFLKKDRPAQESIEEVIKTDDWTKDIKRSKKIGSEVEQLSFIYDSESINMHAIFYAYGPSFKKSMQINTFELIHIYPMLCELLGIKPYENIDGKIQVLKSILK